MLLEHGDMEEGFNREERIPADTGCDSCHANCGETDGRTAGPTDGGTGGRVDGRTDKERRMVRLSFVAIRGFCRSMLDRITWLLGRLKSIMTNLV